MRWSHREIRFGNEGGRRAGELVIQHQPTQVAPSVARVSLTKALAGGSARSVIKNVEVIIIRLGWIDGSALS